MDRRNQLRARAVVYGLVKWSIVAIELAICLAAIIWFSVIGHG